MRQPDSARGTTCLLVTGLLALAACGREEALSDTTRSRSVAAALESGTDLVVTQVGGPASVRNGQSFQATVTVCNQGTVPTSSDRPRVELFLSMDAELTLTDPGNPPPSPPTDQVSIGAWDLAPLQPGQCVTKSMPAYASLPPAAQGEGAYYLAAAVDTQGVEQEAREDNNVLVSGLMGVGERADLVVKQVSGPASVRTNQAFMATVTVCNQGTYATTGGYYPSYGMPRVELFLSTDAELTLPDPSNPSPSMPMDQVSIGYLELDTTLYEGQCTTKSVPVNAYLPPELQGGGAYYLVAAVDTNWVEQELREDNNVRVGGLMGVGERSDLVVTRVDAPASATHGQNFTATVKVCNVGTAPSASYPSRPQVELFLTSDATGALPADPAPIGSLELDVMYEGQCVTKSVPAHAWPPPESQGDGAYYLVATVDRAGVDVELREDNNVHVAGLLGVGYRSDLVVSEVRAPANVWDGQNFTANVKVCNQGTNPSGGYYYSRPRVELFLSTRTELAAPTPGMPAPGQSSSHVSIGYMELDMLHPGQCATKSVPAQAWRPPDVQEDGAYYLTAVVDSQAMEEELREDNNILVSGLMGVGYRSDLVVTDVERPTNVREGQSFTARVKVCNQGTAPTQGYSYPYYSYARVELFLSMDSELTLPTPGSPYPSPGMPMDQASIGSMDIPSRLEPAECVMVDVPANSWLPPGATSYGAYYLIAAVDTTWVEQELREDNNVHLDGLIGVGHRPDLVVSEVSGPASVRDGQQFTATVKVCNQGTTSTSGSRLELYLSSDTELTLPSQGSPYPPPAMSMDQALIGSVDLYQFLEPGQCTTQSVPATAWPPPEAQGNNRAWYLAAVIDTLLTQEELREDNNVRVGGLMGVGHGADLVVSEVHGPASVMGGQSFTATVKVCNQGTVPSSGGSYYNSTRVELFLSTTDTLSMPEQSMPYPEPVGAISIGYVELGQQLYPGQCTTKSVPAHASLPPASNGDGAYYLAAAVDTNWTEWELREDNNVHVGGLMGVGYRSDLVVTELIAPASAGHGQEFTATVKVCNQGTTPTSGGYYYSRPRVELFLSVDDELTLPDPYMPHPEPRDQISIGSVELDSQLAAGQCVTKSMPAYASLPYVSHGDGAYYLAAAVDTNGVEQELREDNNVHVRGLMGVGNRPDLVVSEVSGPASAANGQSFTATVKVCNQGSAPTGGYYYSRPRVELFLSVDTELTLPDPYMPYPEPRDQISIGSVELDQPLSPSQCVTKSVPAYASLPYASHGDGAYYLAAAVDTSWVEQELREDNNIRIGGLMGVGNRPDLVVTEVSGPASVGNGQSFTATVKVCNQGSAPTQSDYYYSDTRVELFLSTDTELTVPIQGSPYPSPDMPMDQISIGYFDIHDYLRPGQCVTKSVPANASPPPMSQGDGAYYLAAAVDTNWVERELREDNNVRVGGLMGVGNRSDLVVKEVSAPASVEHGQFFTATVTVCNQGSSPTTSGSYPYYSRPQVELFLSTNATFSMPSSSPGEPMEQVSIGYTELYEPLYPGQCVTKSVSANAWPPPEAQGDGAYYLVAAVDTTWVEQELREDNNFRVSGLMGVGSRSDLVISEVSAPASVEYGQGFTATVKVCNQGTASTSGSYYSRPRVELYLSMDTELTLPSPGSPSPSPELTRDQELIGTLELYEPLYPSQCVTKSVPASALMPRDAQGDGAYYLAAAVDTTWVEQELREDNNVHVGGLLGVGHRPDLVVTEVSGPVSVGNGQNFTATVKVCNQGSAPTTGYSSSNGPRVELFLSTDTELTLPSPGSPYPPPNPSEQESIGSEYLYESLSPGQCVTKNVHGYGFLLQGAQDTATYYLAAAVDTNWVEQELREDNNVRVGGLIGVGNRADLVVSEVSGPASVEPGQSFTATVKVCNQGTNPTSSYSSSTRVELFLSMDTTLELPSPGSPYPSPGMPSDQILIGSLDLYEPLYPSQCVTKSVSANAWPPPASQGDGAYHLAAAVDTTWVEQELREDNNVRVGGLLGVGYSADLVVKEVSGPASVEYGQGFTATVKVCNQGTAPANIDYSSRPRVELYLSKDTELTLPSPGSPYPSPGMPTDQTVVGTVELDQPLAPSQCVTKSVSAWADLPSGMQDDGVFHLAAVVDTNGVVPELREDNNLRLGGLMGVGSRSDLVVSEVSSPASVGNGQNFAATVKVCNQGTAPTSGSFGVPRVELYLSMDTELELPSPGSPYPSPGMTRDQSLIGSVELNESLYPSQCVTKSVPVTAWLPQDAQGDGAYYLAAAVDTAWVENELREDNNTRIGSLIGVGNRSDLVVGEVSGPASVGNGEAFMATVKVCNQGTAPISGYSGSPRVDLFLSMDTTLELPSPGSPSPSPGMSREQELIGTEYLDGPLYPGQCVTKNMSAHAWPPQQAQGDGAYYLAAAVDTTWVEQELREDNNIRVGNLMGVGYSADLVVSEVSSPASVEPGQAFTATVKVCNQGSAPTNGYASPQVELYLSMDTELTLPSPGSQPPGMPMDQTFIGSVELNQPLNPSQCVTKSVSAHAWLPPEAQGDGAYYLAAAVDTKWVVPELREDNNLRLGGLMGVGSRSDLVVSEVSGPASVTNGQAFTATVSVCNQGTASTSGTLGSVWVELYLSKDTELELPSPGSPPPYPGMPKDQAFLGSVEIDQPLAPSQCVTKSVSAMNWWLSQDSQGDGAYYLAATVDTKWVVPELREDNNTRIGGLVGMGYQSDLVVSGVIAPASLESGEAFTATVKVCNQGTAPSSTSWPRVELYLSTDTELTLPSPGTPYPSPGMSMDQVLIGSVELEQSLAPAECVTKSMPAQAMIPQAAQGDGAYYLAAAVDTTWVDQELREDNNTWLGDLVGVGHQPDLVVSEVTGPVSIQEGRDFTATVKVCNQGTAPTPGQTWLEVFLSQDADLSLSTPGEPPHDDQMKVGGIEVAPLSAGQCVTLDVPAWAKVPYAAQGPGVFYLGAIIDSNSWQQELREDNNTRATSTLEVTY